MATLFEKQNPVEPLNSLTKHNENSIWPQLTQTSFQQGIG